MQINSYIQTLYTQQKFLLATVASFNNIVTARTVF